MRELSDGNLRAPISFSDTRFVAYSDRTLKNFLSNYGTTYDFLNETRNPKANLVNNAPFLLKTTAMADINEVLAKTSKYVQRPELYPWHVDEAIERGLTDLSSIAGKLEAIADGEGSILPPVLSRPDFDIVHAGDQPESPPMLIHCDEEGLLNDSEIEILTLPDEPDNYIFSSNPKKTKHLAKNVISTERNTGI